MFKKILKFLLMTPLERTFASIGYTKVFGLDWVSVGDKVAYIKVYGEVGHYERRIDVGTIMHIRTEDNSEKAISILSVYDGNITISEAELFRYEAFKENK